MRSLTPAQNQHRSFIWTPGEAHLMAERRRDALCDLPLLGLAELIRTRQISSVEATERVLERIASLNERLNAFITVLDKESLQEAREAEREILAGHYRGPLHGVPISVKDLFATKGIRTTAGSR